MKRLLKTLLPPLPWQPLAAAAGGGLLLSWCGAWVGAGFALARERLRQQDEENGEPSD